MSATGNGSRVPARVHWPFGALMLLAFAVYSTACGDGGGAGDEAEPALEQALASVTDSQLAVMPLTAQEFGEAAGLLVNAGPAVAIDNEAAADRSPPENDTAADQERAGRINGYARDYFARDDTDAHVEVVLYQEDASASAAHAEGVAELKALEGQRRSGYETELVFDAVETFAVDTLGGEATGLRLPVHEKMSEYRRQTTAVVFSYARLLIAVSENRPDNTDVASQVEKAAQAQVERIEGVLKGEIVDTPEPEPTPPPEVPSPLSFGDAPLTPGGKIVEFASPDQSGTEGELLYTGLRVEAVDFDRERIDFALIGPYSGPLPGDVKVADELKGVCQVLQVTSAAGETELNLLPGEELVFTVEYACEAGRAVKFVGLFGFIFERP